MVKPVGFLMVISSLTILALQITGGPAQAGKTAGSVGFPHLDRVLFLEDTSEESANVSIGDLNGDGYLDIVLAKGRHSPLVNRVLFNDGAGRHFAPVQFGDNKGTVYGFAFGDLNKDGFPDIAVARSGAPNVVYFGALPSRKVR